MVIIYDRDESKTYSSIIIPGNFFSGTNVFINSQGQVVLTASKNRKNRNF